MSRLRIIAGSASHVLASRVARELGLTVAELQIRRFPDGEKYLRVLEDVKGEDVAVISSMHHTPDELLFEYLMLVDALMDLGAREVAAFIPYFPYARQDERFNPGEALTFKTVCKLIESVGTSRVYTVDMHQHRVLDTSSMFTIPYRNLSAMPLIAEYVKEHHLLNQPIVIGPDAESEQWAKTVAERLGSEHDVFEKKRLGDERVTINPRRVNPEGREVLIVDDIISTGVTVAETLKVLSERRARKVVVTCTHPILAGTALAKIYSLGAEMVVGTDTVLSPVSYITVASIIAEEIKKHFQ